MKPAMECRTRPSFPTSRHVALDEGGMATLAAQNISSFLQGYPGYDSPDMTPFVDGDFDSMPGVSSIVNMDQITR